MWNYHSHSEVDIFPHRKAVVPFVLEIHIFVRFWGELLHYVIDQVYEWILDCSHYGNHNLSFRSQTAWLDILKVNGLEQHTGWLTYLEIQQFVIRAFVNNPLDFHHHLYSLNFNLCFRQIIQLTFFIGKISIYNCHIWRLVEQLYLRCVLLVSVFLNWISDWVNANFTNYCRILI